MTTNKNQHFVPRCYLRPFTIDGNNAAINLYNIDSRRFISLAPVKNQCSRDNFYGQDENLEKAIKSVEDSYAITLREILSPGYILTDAHKTILRMFWLFQHLRTEAAAKRAVECAAIINEAVGIIGSKFRLSIKDAVISAMHIFVEEMQIVDDLKICLVRNKTQIPFFTSDDPAVLTNRWWLNDKRTKGRSFGLRSAGIIILLPLSPRLLCLGYDGDVYNVPHHRGTVDVRRNRDIASFNQFQIINCRANLFIKDAEHSIVVHEAFTEAAKNRPVNRYRINYAVHDRTEGKYERYRVIGSRADEKHTKALLHTQVIRPIPLSWPNIITRSILGAVYTNGTGLGYVRYAETKRSNTALFHKERPYRAFRNKKT